MARTLRDAKLDTRSARLKLKVRREPYWRSISEGLAIGYRKGAKGGTWIARHYSAEEGRRYFAIGTADDVADADGAHVLSFAQAQEGARRWFGDLGRCDAGEVASGPYTVSNALDDYLADYKRRGGKAEARLKWAIEAHVRPDLGDIPVARFTRRRIEAWHAQLSEAPARLRTKRGKRQAHRAIDPTEDGVRRRRSTANRLLTILKATLNLALHNRRVVSHEAWTAVKPFREVDAPKVRYLADDEARRLVNASAPVFRTLVVGALLTGARYGELAAMTASDYNSDTGSVFIGRSKGGKARHVHLTSEGQAFFGARAAGRTSGDLLFPRKDGRRWSTAHQFRPIQDACKAAKIKPAIGFHVLRHTYASRLAMRGVPMAVIAAQLGHTDTRMTERHYAHLAPSYVAETVRAAFGSLDIVSASNVVPIAAKA
jgi:integrase